MITMVRKAGRAIVVSCQSMFPTCSIIMIPTKTSMGEVAALGMNVRRGRKKVLKRKRNALTTAVSPALPIFAGSHPSNRTYVHSRIRHQKRRKVRQKKKKQRQWSWRKVRSENPINGAGCRRMGDRKIAL